MARGSEGKERRKEARKEARKGKEDEDENEWEESQDDIPFPMPPSVAKNVSSASGGGDQDDDDDDDVDLGDKILKSEPSVKKKIEQGKAKRIAEKLSNMDKKNETKKEGIKTLPLILLILLTGTTLLPALLYLSDRLGGMVQKKSFFGTVGHKLGIGPSPKKRVISFYEKHDPTKLKEVDDILSKYYGDYSTLIKRLERKYGDYGYFINWQEDEAAWKLAMTKLVDTRDYLQKKFDQKAPQVLKIAAFNVKTKFTRYYRKGKIIWRKKLWPVLEPYLGVPEGTAAQKRKDREAAKNSKASSKGGRRKRNEDFRDENEF